MCLEKESCLNVGLGPAEGARRQGEGVAHLILLTALAATAGIMAVTLLSGHGGPAVMDRISLYA